MNSVSLLLFIAFAFANNLLSKYDDMERGINNCRQD